MAPRKKQKLEEFEVEDIISYDIETEKFRVRWKNFGADDDTWESEANLKHAPDFKAKMKEKKEEAGAFSKRKVPSKEARACAPKEDHTRPMGTSAVDSLTRSQESQFTSFEASQADIQREGEEEPETEEMEYVLYPPGSKIPKIHLPDENALGSKLAILRFKRHATLPVAGSSCGEGTSADSDEAAGQHISVTYCIDGKIIHTMPFNEARKYCTQALLSYLVKRTTFRSSQDAVSNQPATPETRETNAEDSSKSDKRILNNFGEDRNDLCPHPIQNSLPACSSSFDEYSTAKGSPRRIQNETNHN